MARTRQSTAPTRAHLRATLAARRRDLIADLQRRIERIREHSAASVEGDELEAADPCDLDVRLLEIGNATLRRIDTALERLNDGHYGRCTVCHGPIAEVRLRAMPHALRCHQCEAAREREALARRSALRSRVWTESPAAGRVGLDEP